MGPKTIFRPHIEPQNSQLGPTKVKNNPKIKSKSNFRLEGSIENKSLSTTWVDPKTIFKPSSLGPQKVKNDPKIKSNSKNKIEGTIENKSCSAT